MAGSQTTRRPRNEAPVEPEPKDGPLVEASFDERTLGTAAEEAELAAAAKVNDGAEVELGVDIDDHFLVEPGLDDDLPAEPFEEDFPEPVTTHVKLNLGKRFGRREVRLVHKPGCPGHPYRVEPSIVGTPRGRKGIVTRCCDCAQQTYTRLT